MGSFLSKELGEKGVEVKGKTYLLAQWLFICTFRVVLIFVELVGFIVCSK